jgi:hypothetical protein
MDPDAFEWGKASDVYSVKVLGRFTERDVVIAKLRWDAAGPIDLPADRAYYIYVLGGELRTDAGTYGAHTTVQSGFDEADSVHAAAGTEAMCFAFPPSVLENDVFTARSMASVGSS